MWELVQAGGWLMLPLGLCSVFALAISLERLIRLRKADIIPQALCLKADQPLQAVMDALYQQPHLKASSLGRIFMAGEHSRLHSAEYARAQMEAVASEEIGRLEKNINFLGTLSAIAPLLGLLGTVLGIIEAFLMLDLTVQGDPRLMIPGISKALITTAAGMFIAIPALVAYRYFQRVVQEHIAVLEQQATRFHAAYFYQSDSR